MLFAKKHLDSTAKRSILFEGISALNLPPEKLSENDRRIIENFTLMNVSSIGGDLTKIKNPTILDWIDKGLKAWQHKEPWYTSHKKIKNKKTSEDEVPPNQMACYLIRQHGHPYYGHMIITSMESCKLESEVQILEVDCKSEFCNYGKMRIMLKSPINIESPIEIEAVISNNNGTSNKIKLKLKKIPLIKKHQPPEIKQPTIQEINESKSEPKKTLVKKLTIQEINESRWELINGNVLKAPCPICTKNSIRVTQYDSLLIISLHNGGLIEPKNQIPACSDCCKSIGSQNLVDFVKVKYPTAPILTKLPIVV